MKDNIPGFMGYYVSKTGSVYSRYVRGSMGKLSNILNNSYENKESRGSKR